MNKVLPIILTILITLNAQTLFEVKDAQDSTVFQISNDGMRIFNNGDTLMVISSSEIKAFIDEGSKDRALSRSFSITTSTSAEKLVGTHVLDVTTDQTTMREGGDGNQYTNFSPDNISLGLNSGINNAPNDPILNDGTANVFVGNNAGASNNSGQKNIFMGDSAGFSTTSGDRNIFIGSSAGQSNFGGYENIFIGTEAGMSVIGEDHNIFIGNAAGKKNRGDDNIFIGSFAGVENTTGAGNMFIGNNAGAGNITSGYNVYVGNTAGTHVDGYKNTFVGVMSGYGVYTGGYNTYIGQYAGYDNDGGSNNVCIGRGCTVSGSNKLAIDATVTTTPLVYGEFDNDLLRVNGDLDVTGTITVAGLSTFNGNVGIGETPTTLYGVRATNHYTGVMGRAVSTGVSNFTYGVYGDADGGTSRNISIYGSTATGTGTNWSGYFTGNIYVGGTVSKSADQVKIDHPLDPKNKFLSHSTIISDQMTSIYHGNVILDSEGKAVVGLPKWMEALNTEFRYQLTAIGGAAPSLHIAKEVSNSIFEIAGGKPNMKISWEITGIRNDNYAKSNPIEVEIDKDSIEKGYYLHPEAYGLPEEQGIDFQHEKAMKEQSSN